MLSQDVCPSLCSSVTQWYSVKTVRHILRLFMPLVSHIILVFAYQTVWQYSDGDPLHGGVECKGG